MSAEEEFEDATSDGGGDDEVLSYSGVMATLNAEWFIDEVGRRPALYDARRADTKRDRDERWREIGAALVPGWDALREASRRAIVSDLAKKWKNIKDAYLKELKIQMTGVARKNKRKYIHFDQLSFLYPLYADDPANNKDTTSVKNEPTLPKTPTLKRKRIPGTYMDVYEHIEILEPEPLPAVKTKGNKSLVAFPESARIPIPAETVKRKNKAVFDPLETESGNWSPSTSGKTSHSDNAALQELIDILKEHPQVQRLRDGDDDDGGNRAFLLSFVPIMDAMAPEMIMEVRYRISNLFRVLQRSISGRAPTVKATTASRKRGKVKRRSPIVEEMASVQSESSSVESEQARIEIVKCEFDFK